MTAQQAARGAQVIGDFMNDQREPVLVIPPGASTEHVGELIETLGKVVRGHELHMANQDDGSIAVFYYRDEEERRKQRANDVILEADDMNVELEVGFTGEDGEPGTLRYASSESDEAILGLASFMVPVLESWDAANYVTTTIVHEDTKYGFTIQRGNGMTPAEKIAQLEAQIELLTSG